MDRKRFDISPKITATFNVFVSTTRALRFKRTIPPHRRLSQHARLLKRPYPRMGHCSRFLGGNMTAPQRSTVAHRQETEQGMEKSTGKATSARFSARVLLAEVLRRRCHLARRGSKAATVVTGNLVHRRTPRPLQVLHWPRSVVASGRIGCRTSTGRSAVLSSIIVSVPTGTARSHVPHRDTRDDCKHAICQMLSLTMQKAGRAGVQRKKRS